MNFQAVTSSVGMRIQEHRKRCGMTQQELAKKAGVFDVGEMERGRKVKGGTPNPRLDTLWKIAEALNVGIEVFFKDIGLDEHTVEIRELLEGQDPATKEKAVRVVQVVVGE